MSYFDFHRLKDIVDWRMFLSIAIALIGAFLCNQLNIVADFPLSLIGIAIIFPLVFSINAAFKRREHALQAFATIKAHAYALVLASEDWIVNHSDKDFSEEFRGILNNLVQALQTLMQSESNDPSDVYNQFSALSAQVKAIRPHISSGEMSRMNQYVSKMLISFEQMETIRTYRTSVYLTTYGKAITYLFPILYAPYFGHHINEFSPNWLGYALPAIYTMVLNALLNVQELLEDPLDGVGLDDLRVEAPVFLSESFTKESKRKFQADKILG